MNPVRVLDGKYRDQLGVRKKKDESIKLRMQGVGDSPWPSSASSASTSSAQLLVDANDGLFSIIPSYGVFSNDFAGGTSRNQILSLDAECRSISDNAKVN